MGDDRLRVSVFNCQWRASTSGDAAVIRKRVLANSPDIVCLTEAYRDFFGSEGHLIEAAPEYGYPIVEGRRKVMLWSRQPWTSADAHGSDQLPPGRFVAGRTTTSIGEINVVGVCIPWARAHVSSGNRNRRPWEDHLAYLSVLNDLLPAPVLQTLVIGDFNQRVPLKFQSQLAFDALSAALLTRMTLATGGDIEPIGKQAIDHICHGRDMECERAISLSNVADDGRLISDHFGIDAVFRLAQQVGSATRLRA